MPSSLVGKSGEAARRRWYQSGPKERLGEVYGRWRGSLNGEEQHGQALRRGNLKVCTCCVKTVDALCIEMDQREEVWEKQIEVSSSGNLR